MLVKVKVGDAAMQARVLVFALVATTLAGCSDGSPAQEATDQSVSIADEFRATESTGVILGIVVDETIRPIAGAAVRVETTPPRDTLTNDAGEFGFGAVEPGTYIVEVLRVGYFPAKATVQVEAGVDRPPLVKLQLRVDAANQPYVQVFQFEGFLQCGINYLAVCGVGPFAGTLLCTQVGVCVGNITADEFIAFHEIDGPPHWVQAEMAWESTQSLSEELSLLQSFGDRESFNQGFISGTLNRTTGPSPIYVTVNRTVATNESVMLGVDNHLVPRVFSASIPATRQCGPPPLDGQCVSFGFAIEQRFTIYTHVFYAYEPPEGWRFTDTGDVPRP